jgi:hypothetical protein
MRIYPDSCTEPKFAGLGSARIDPLFTEPLIDLMALHHRRRGQFDEIGHIYRNRRSVHLFNRVPHRKQIAAR